MRECSRRRYIAGAHIMVNKFHYAHNTKLHLQCDAYDITLNKYFEIKNFINPNNPTRAPFKTILCLYTRATNIRRSMYTKFF